VKDGTRVGVVQFRWSNTPIPFVHFKLFARHFAAQTSGEGGEMVRFIATSTALVLALAGSANAAGPTDGINVNVLNAPLPVTGTLSGSVTGSVSVNNSAASPVPVRDVDSAATQPIQFRLCFAAGLGLPVSCNSIPHEVQLAADKRLVIEYVSGGCFLGGEVTNVKVIVQTFASGVLGNHQMHLQADVLDRHTPDIAQQTRIYADAGSKINLAGSAGAGATPSSVDCTVTISGYTVTQ